jgi:hypothetical protein
MVKVQIQGVTLEVPEPVAAELDARAKRLDALESEIPKRVQKRIELLESARARKVKHDAAMGDDELIAAIVAKAFPTLPLEKLALSHEQLMAMLEASAGVAVEPDAAPAADSAPPAPPAPPEEERRMDAASAGRPPLDPPGAGAPTKSPLELAREQARERDAAAYKRKAS